MRLKLLVPVMLFAVVALAAACSVVGGEGPGIGRTEAVRLAQQHAGPIAEFEFAEPAANSSVVPLDQQPRPVWLVYFSGIWPMPCPAAEGTGPADCPDYQSAIVALDLYSGEFVGVSYQR